MATGLGSGVRASNGEGDSSGVTGPGEGPSGGDGVGGGLVGSNIVSRDATDSASVASGGRSVG